MRRSLRTRLLICLLLGVVSTVVVGVLGPRFGTAEFRFERSTNRSGFVVASDMWLVPVPDHWKALCHTMQFRTTCGSLLIQHDADLARSYGYAVHQDHLHVVSILNSGWPWPAFESTRLSAGGHVRPYTIQAFTRVFPDTVHPLPFLLDVLIHGTLWVLAFLVVGLVRRAAYRARRRADPWRSMCSTVLLGLPAMLLTVLTTWLCPAPQQPWFGPRTGDWVDVSTQRRTTWLSEVDDEFRMGWPLRALTRSSGGSREWVPAQEDPYARAWEHGMIAEIWPFGDRPLAIRPLWPGFLLNTLFYAGVLWLVTDRIGAVRRLRRVRRGRCPVCNYDCTGVAVCPECGSAGTHAAIARP